MIVITVETDTGPVEGSQRQGASPQRDFVIGKAAGGSQECARFLRNVVCWSAEGEEGIHARDSSLRLSPRVVPQPDIIDDPSDVFDIPGVAQNLVEFVLVLSDTHQINDPTNRIDAVVD